MRNGEIVSVSKRPVRRRSSECVKAKPSPRGRRSVPPSAGRAAQRKQMTFTAEIQTHKRAICRCRIKGCGFIKSFDVPTVQKRITTRWHTFLAREACPGTMMTLANDERCPSHPRNLMSVRVVIGKLNPDHVCDSRCASAKGHTCECACGGENHGANWL